MTDDLEIRLKKVLEECAQLRAENASLRLQFGIQYDVADTNSDDKQSSFAHNTLSIEKKISLFRSYFRGREDVYALRWEGKDGKKGYSPACSHDWDCPSCSHDRKARRSRCENRKFHTLTDQSIHDHLSGKTTIGLYPLLTDETCWFLAVDFDKANWLEDVRSFISSCKEHNIGCLLERSRSGKGGHVWIFFENPISASLARRLGSFLLTKAMEKRHQVGLDSYDRLFPNQDTIPKGGFGNLIALPLQREPRSHGNSVFIDENGNMYEDQWAVLAATKKINPNQIHQILAQVQFHTEVGNIPLVSEEDEKPIKPWEITSEKSASKKINGLFPEKVRVVMANMVCVEKHGLPTAMLNRLLRIAAFQNPEFYRAQAMRLSTYDKPRIISCGQNFPDHVAVPRGCLDEILALLKEHGIKPELVDERFTGKSITVKFKGELRDLQKKSVSELSEHDNGVLSATTAFGKTVVASWMIAKRKTNTLILVHRKQLMDQWKERLALFLDLPPKSIGEIGGGKSKATGIIDIATMQALHREGEVKPVVADYGHVIIDECHHVSAFSFEQVLKQAKAKYVLGLTATPFRKDGHHPIITMQCGPIRFKATAKQQSELNQFEHVVLPRYTNFNLPEINQKFSIQEIYGLLVQDQNRNDLIFNDLLKALESGRSPLVLTERTEHLDYLENRLKGFAKNMFVLQGGMGKKKRQELQEQIANLPDSEERVILATGRYIGEGFDDSRLDTLFLVIPISWKGTLQQYVGRLHRSHDGKKLLQVYDYVDHQVPMLRKMFERRLTGYKTIGYSSQNISPLNQAVSFGLKIPELAYQMGQIR